MIRIFRNAVAGLLLLAVAVTSLRAQGRRLQSRAAFARLDSAALVDSAELRPLDPNERFDSLMLKMVSHLTHTL